MQEKKNPLSPHLQIYKWQISSLLSITHRIVGVINILAISAICFWSLFLLLGAENYEVLNNFFNSFFGKFIAVGLCWTFSFHILNELRHLFWDMGYGFDLKISRITGVLALSGFLCSNNIILFNWKKYFLKCIHQQKNGYLQNLAR